MPSTARRRFFIFEFSTEEDLSVRMSVGAYSVRQAWWLFHQGKAALGVTFILYKISWWKCRRPPGAPRQGPFVMHKGEVIALSRKGVTR